MKRFFPMNFIRRAIYSKLNDSLDLVGNFSRVIGMPDWMLRKIVILYQLIAIDKSKDLSGC